MADEFQAVLSADRKTMTVTRKDGGVMATTIVDSLTSFNSKSGRAAWEALQVAAQVVELVDPTFAATMRTQAENYFTPPAEPAVSPTVSK